jgi:hypothetical protein
MGKSFSPELIFCFVYGAPRYIFLTRVIPAEPGPVATMGPGSAPQEFRDAIHKTVFDAITSQYVWRPGIPMLKNGFPVTP